MGSPHGKNLLGKRFKMLLVIGDAGIRGRHHLWLCRCDCGVEKTITSSNLQNTNRVSCGCRKRTQAITHGLSSSGVYKSYKCMVSRCHSPKNASYGAYGGRGITVHPDWLGAEGLERFCEYMGARPKGAQIDRIDTDGNYEPGNVRWATPKQQARNKRNNHRITHNGKTQSLAAWGDEPEVKALGISEFLIFGRLKRGWSPSEALTHPLKKNGAG